MIATRLIPLAILASAAPARAQTAEAEVLFREGKRLLADGDVASACAKLEASERLDAAVGTELNLADCFERAGKPASAWAMFTKAEQSARRLGDGKRASEAKRRGAELVGKLVYLTIDVPDGRQPDGLVIERDGTRVDRVLWNQRMVLDPGTYKLAASAPGYLAWHASIALSENRTVEVPVLERAPLENPFPKDDAPAKPAAVARAADDADEHEPPAPEPRRYVGASIALAVVGVGAIAAGATFGYIAGELESRSSALCKAAACSSALGVDEATRARRDAMIADGALAAGGVALATAATLVLLGRPSAQVERVMIVPLSHGAGLTLGGRF